MNDPHNEKQNNNPSSEIVDLQDVPEMDALMEQKQTEELARGMIVSGKVVEKTDNGVLVDIGFKAESLIPREEFREFESIQPGDSVDVYIEALEDEESELPLLSARKAAFEKAWENFNENYEEGSRIKGMIVKRVKGGLSVDLDGIIAFLPGSQVDVVPVRDMDELLGKEEEFKVLKISPERRNVVVSRRAVIEEERAQRRTDLLETLAPGQICTGTVKNITDFGAFVDFNGIDGLLHITDMSWGRISHPSEMVSIGDEIEVMILDIDYEKQRLSLGLKQKEQNPWEAAAEKYPPETKVKGTVVNVLPYGAFVELEKGIEGLVHVSELSWTKKITNAADYLTKGEEIEAVVLEVKPEEKKISLGVRQLSENPWEELAEEYPEGSRVKGVVRNLTPYGAFVQIKDDIDGMIHVSDMSWTKKINHPGEMVKKGEEIEAVVLEINPEQQRISLGLKQLSEDPWNRIQNELNVGDTVKGAVTKTVSFGAFVKLESEIEGLIHISELSDEHINSVEEVANPGDEIEARVIKIDPSERRIGLSLRPSAEEKPEVEAMEGTEQGTTSESGEGETASFGDLGAALHQAESENEKEDEGGDVSTGAEEEAEEVGGYSSSASEASSATDNSEDKSEE